MRHQRGFTIIEVLLFLSISGLLMALLFVGTGVAIQRQQYQDTIQSFAGFVRGQYAAMVSVENNNEAGATCPIDGRSAVRGQSSCVVVGRYLQADGSEGRTYMTFPIYAKQVGDSWEYRYGNEDGRYEVSWGARTKLASGSDGDAVKASIAIYRHPDTGQVAVKGSRASYASRNIRSLLDGPVTTTKQEICVYETGWLPHERRSVFISAYAESSDAITVGPASEGCKDGNA